MGGDCDFHPYLGAFLCDMEQKQAKTSLKGIGRVFFLANHKESHAIFLKRFVRIQSSTLSTGE
jgi:hypothetical protein